MRRNLRNKFRRRLRKIKATKSLFAFMIFGLSAFPMSTQQVERIHLSEIRGEVAIASKRMSKSFNGVRKFFRSIFVPVSTRERIEGFLGSVKVRN